MEEEMPEENAERPEENAERPEERAVVHVGYYPGDLLWTKCGGYPYWPCMITYDPVNGKFTRQTKRKRNTQIYHVQYFGPDVLRGWTSPGSSFLFKGENEFLDKIQELTSLINNPGNKTPKTLLDKYKVPNMYREKWAIAVKEAEKALLCSDIRERFEAYVYVFEEIKKSSNLQEKPVENDLSFASSEPSTSKKLKVSGPLCDTCGKSDINFPCSMCEKFFHLGCVGLTDIPENFNCFECVSLLIQPSNFRAISSSPTTVQLTWTRPSQARDNIIGYELHWKKANSDFHYSREIPDLETYTLEELRSNTMYIFWLACRSEKGEIVATPPVKVLTQKEDDPVPVSGSTIYINNEVKANFSIQVSTENISSIGCFVCLNGTGSIIKCSILSCLNFYHMDCISKFECTQKEKKICPQHACVTCYRIKPGNAAAFKEPITKCTQCPMAFHNRESCIPAGSTELKKKKLVCPLHYVGRNKVSSQPVCNMNSCAKCNTGGELVCCDACPIAFHEKCLNIPITSEDFLCEDCENKSYLLYGMIVWTKVGHYRWWPGRIIHPSKVPSAMNRQSHCEGEFPVKFFGTHNHAWTHSGRTFPFAEDHKAVVSRSKTTLGNNYSKALQEAAFAFDDYTTSQQNSVDKEPMPYIPIKTCQTSIPIPKNPKEKERLICICNPKAANPCAPESNCINRATYIECNPKLCHAEKECQNRQFRKRDYAATNLVKTENCGWGLKAKNFVKKGQFVIEYVGEIITHEEYLKRSRDLQKNGIEDFYFLYLDANRIIDAGPMGNKGRFINHSCEPNCVLEKWCVLDDQRIGIFATRDISAGEELTFDYQSEKYDFNQKCLCGAAKCRGNIGKEAKSKRKVPITKRKTLLSPKSDVDSTSKSKLPKVDLDSTSKSKLPKVDLSSDADHLKVADHLKSKQIVPITIENEARHKNLPSPKLDVADSTSKSMLPEVSLSRNSEASEVDGHLKETSNSMKDSKVQLVVFQGILPKIKIIPYKSDNICFVCKKIGTLLLCDKIGCSRAFHLSCVGLQEKPKGSYFCAMHKCFKCKKRPHLSCRICTKPLCITCCKVMPPPDTFVCRECRAKNQKAKAVNGKRRVAK